MAESNDSNAASIPLSALPLFSQLPPISVKLTNGNFLIWKQQVDVVVYGYELESFLTGEASPPPQMIVDPAVGSLVINPAFFVWQRSAKDIWGALENNFPSHSTAKVMQYRQQMQNLRKETLSMSEYLGKMRNYFDLLNSVGCMVSDGEQILHILGGLGQEYDPAVCVVTSRSEPWAIGDVSSFLLSFESRMETTRANSSSTEGSQPSLHLVQQQSGPKKDLQSYNNKFDTGGGRGGSRNQRGGRGGRGFGRGDNKIVMNKN
ncbi:uncharacterized protein LOC121801010 [Salvia splendens]|uniref:uncharacterized protein LOC121801010 n=1 Tax=Salvia splendens TaxID=180675 RepID=UPI001C27D8D9|nr:uncharacterized protein LOC121801010 [Salvia splendens]